MSLIENGIKRLEGQAGAQGIGRVPLSAVTVNKDGGAPNAASDALTSVPRRIVSLNRTELVKTGFLPPHPKQRQLADQFRHVKRPLLAAARGRGGDPLANGRNIMVASSLPGEGKTFVSVNLAISMSLEHDFSVVLVDADVAKPHISHVFGIDKEPGLLDALRHEALDVESLVLPTDVHNLSVLPAGRHVETATELIASNRMETVVARLAGNAASTRLVVFDSPPLLLTTESRVLAQLMGQIVLVVRAGFTPQHAVLDSIECIGGGKPISLLLNQSESVNESGYYYRDGTYGAYGRNKATQPDDDSGSMTP
jgi:exopolysaccharide/PEP-CTERM locus tyrosine autokinase